MIIIKYIGGLIAIISLINIPIATGVEEMINNIFGIKLPIIWPFIGAFLGLILFKLGNIKIQKK